MAQLDSAFGCYLCRKVKANRKVGGSSPPRGGVPFFLFLLVSSVECIFLLSFLFDLLTDEEAKRVPVCIKICRMLLFRKMESLDMLGVRGSLFFPQTSAIIATLLCELEQAHIQCGDKSLNRPVLDDEDEPQVGTQRLWRADGRRRTEIVTLNLASNDHTAIGELKTISENTKDSPVSFSCVLRKLGWTTPLASTRALAALESCISILRSRRLVSHSTR